MSVILQGSVLVVFFNIFVGNMKCILHKFADDIRLRGAVDMLEGGYTIQRDLDRPERWSHANLMKFNKVM